MIILLLSSTMLMLIFGYPIPKALDSVDCSGNKCFGEPLHCNSQSCRILFNFDEENNVHLYLRNFTDPFGYAAFAVRMKANHTFDYLVCIPHIQERFCATAILGRPIHIIRKNMTGSVRKFGTNDFICTFPYSELGDEFQREQSFFVTVGKFNENVVVYDGVQLYSFENNNYDDNDDEDEDDEEIDYTDDITTPTSKDPIDGDSDDIGFDQNNTENNEDGDHDEIEPAEQNKDFVQKIDVEPIISRKYIKRSSHQEESFEDDIHDNEDIEKTEDAFPLLRIIVEDAQEQQRISIDNISDVQYTKKASDSGGQQTYAHFGNNNNSTMTKDNEAHDLKTNATSAEIHNNFKSTGNHDRCVFISIATFVALLHLF